MGHIAHQRNSSKSIKTCPCLVKEKKNILLFEIGMFVRSPSPILYGLCQFDWNWLSGSAEEDFKIMSLYFCYLIIISPWKRVWPFIETNLNLLHPTRLCVKFGWNWSSGRGEEADNMKSLQTDWQTDGQQGIWKAHISFQIRWAKKNHRVRKVVLNIKQNCPFFTELQFKNNEMKIKFLLWNTISFSLGHLRKKFI